MFNDLFSNLQLLIKKQTFFFDAHNYFGFFPAGSSSFTLHAMHYGTMAESFGMLQSWSNECTQFDHFISLDEVHTHDPVRVTVHSNEERRHSFGYTVLIR